jgi:hypothetical protein
MTSSSARASGTTLNGHISKTAKPTRPGSATTKSPQRETKNSTPAPSQFPFIIYCLHDLGKLGATAHYIGRCRVDQFKRRIREHYGGRGARDTRRAYAEGRNWVLVSWLETDDPESEYNKNTRQSLVGRCHLCQIRAGQDEPD